jgi:hypothetical protein
MLHSYARLNYVLRVFMRITVTLPDEIARKVCRLPDRDAFVSKAVADALAQEAEAPSETGLSRWARLAGEIEQRSQALGDYRESFDQDRKDFRETFRFDHDDHG